LFRYTDESLYAGRTIQFGGWVFQLSLPLFQSRSFEPFSTNQAQIAHPMGYGESDDLDIYSLRKYAFLDGKHLVVSPAGRIQW
jgi:hypothetical protein